MLVRSQVKYIQSLGQKKFRDSEGVFVAEGPKIINELLKAPNLKPVHVFAVHEWLEENPSIASLLPPGVLATVKDTELERISFLSTANQAIAVFQKPFFEDIVVENRISLVLDSIQDPGNLGTMLRIADWFGLSSIICSRDSADIFNPKTVQSTMGSISRVQVKYEELKTFIIAHAAMPVYAATLSGEPLYGMNRIQKGLIIIGNESKGISPDILSLVRHKITIPGSGHAESLNAAVAAGIILSHLV